MIKIHTRTVAVEEVCHQGGPPPETPLLVATAAAIVPGVKAEAEIGHRRIVPLGHIHAAHVRSHFDTAELTVWDGPRRAEILCGLAMATGPRPHARIGRLSSHDLVGDDGLRRSPHIRSGGVVPRRVRRCAGDRP